MGRHVSERECPCTILLLFLIYKCARKPLLGNLFVIGRIFFGRLTPEDIQYCHS